MKININQQSRIWFPRASQQIVIAKCDNPNRNYRYINPFSIITKYRNLYDKREGIFSENTNSITLELSQYFKNII